MNLKNKALSFLLVTLFLSSCVIEDQKLVQGDFGIKGQNITLNSENLVMAFNGNSNENLQSNQSDLNLNNDNVKFQFSIRSSENTENIREKVFLQKEEFNSDIRYKTIVTP